MNIEKYKLKLESAIYENCDKHYIGGKIVEDVLNEHYAEQLNLPLISDSLAADIRNKLSPVKNLCAMLKNREVDPYMEKNDKLNKLVDYEIEKSLKVVEWLSSL
jgi:hypothetical protein